MPVTSITEIQSRIGNNQCNRLCKIIKSFVSGTLNNSDAADDITQAFEEALKNAVCNGSDTISLKIYKNINNSISLEMIYPEVSRMKFNLGNDLNFGYLYLTQFSDSIEYTVNAGKTVIRMIKQL